MNERLGWTVGLACVGIFVAAGIILLITGTAEIRYSADHLRTIPVWHVWFPALVTIVLIRLVPPRLPRVDPLTDIAPERIRRETLVCLGAAGAFAVVLVAGSPMPDGWYVALKIGLLVVVPSIALGDGWLRAFTGGQPVQLGRWYWIGPAVAVGAWLALAWIGPLARPSFVDATAMALIAGFLLNAVVEEVFYRVWLQTRLEALIGRWAGIACVALLWAAWHLGLHATGNAAIDLATVVAHLGVLGLMLGYLWSRYRNPWALLVVHGAINAPLALLAA